MVESRNPGKIRVGVPHILGLLERGCHQCHVNMAVLRRNQDLAFCFLSVAAYKNNQLVFACCLEQTFTADCSWCRLPMLQVRRHSVLPLLHVPRCITRSVEHLNHFLCLKSIWWTASSWKSFRLPWYYTLCLLGRHIKISGAYAYFSNICRNLHSKVAYIYNPCLAL